MTKKDLKKLRTLCKRFGALSDKKLFEQAVREPTETEELLTEIQSLMEQVSPEERVTSALERIAAALEKSMGMPRKRRR